MSKELEARLRTLEHRLQSGEFWQNIKTPIPLAGMSKTWQDQYRKDPEVISELWHSVVNDYNDKHIDEWRQHPEQYKDAYGKISNTPPWYSLVPDDQSEWYKELIQDAEVSLVLWQTVGGGRKEALNDDN